MGCVCWGGVALEKGGMLRLVGNGGAGEVRGEGGGWCWSVACDDVCEIL